MIHQADLYLEAIQGNLTQILSFLIDTNQPSWLVFSEQKTELEEYCTCSKTLHES